MINAKSTERLAQLTPEFQTIVKALLEAGYANGMNPQISSGYRSPEEQDKIYAQGRTDKGAKVTNSRRWQSMHQYHIAVDLFFLVDGKADFHEDKYHTLWNLACKAGLDRQGLQWSGNWTGSFKESAHFQLGKGDWRELAKSSGVDTITLNKVKVQNV